MEVILDPAETSWTAPSDLPVEGVLARIVCHGPAGKAGEGGNIVTGYVRRRGGTCGGVGVRDNFLILPGQTYNYIIGLGGSENDTWFDDPLNACGSAALNSGAPGVTNAGDFTYPGVQPVALPAGNVGQGGSGAPGIDGPGAAPVGVTGGDGNNGETPGGAFGAPGVDGPNAGSGAGALASGTGPGLPGGFPAGGPSPGRGKGQPSGHPGDGRIQLIW